MGSPLLVFVLRGEDSHNNETIFRDRKMVLPFASTLPNNLTNNVCGGVVLYEQQRPKISSAILAVNVSLFIFFAALLLGSIPLAYITRQQSYFRKIRPYSISTLFFLFLLFFATSTYLAPVITTYPCWLFAAGYIFGLGGMAVCIFLRILLIAIETRYSQLASADRKIFQSDEINSQISSTNKSSVTEEEDTLPLSILLKISLGITSFDKLKISEIATSRNSYIWLCLIYMLPFLISFIILIAVVPEFRNCTDCVAFMELPIVIVG